MPTKNRFKKSFPAYYILKVLLHHFSKIKSQKNVTKQYICLLIEGSGSIPLTNGSGSGSRRPKNMWIRWIRIRNTGKKARWKGSGRTLR
jgi:hypothetical protein